MKQLNSFSRIWAFISIGRWTVISVFSVTTVDSFFNDMINLRTTVLEKKLPDTYGIRIGQITQQPYGKEFNVIDPAGVCWHFVEQ